MKFKHFLCGMLALSVAASCFISNLGTVITRADELTASVSSADDLHSFTVSDPAPELGERITLSAVVNAPEGKEMASVSYDAVTGRSGIGMSDWVTDDYTTHTVTLDVTANYLGKYGFSCILVRYADGSSTLYYDPTMIDPDNLPYPAEETVAVDMSGSFALVEGEDQSAPVFALDSLVVSPAAPVLGDTVAISVAVSDDTVIGTTGSFEYEVNGSRMGIPAYYSKENGRLFCDLTLNEIGEYRLVDFSVWDAGGNKSMLLNSQSGSCTEIIDMEDSSTNILTADLSGFNITVDEIEDDEAPVIHLETLSVSTGKAARMEHVNVAVSIEEDYGLQEAYLQFAFNDKNGMSGSMEAVSGSDSYSYTLVPAYYGFCHLYSMLVIDDAGNTVYYVDESLRNYDWNTPGSPYYRQDAYWDQVQFADLSAASFEVGVRESSTGIYAFGNGMAEDASLSVIELPQSGTIFDAHVNEEMEVAGYYELTMSGTYTDEQNGSVRVDFPVTAEEGTAVQIDHVLADGSTQTVTTTVNNGIASIEVMEFSPFLIQTAKSATPGKTETDNQDIPDEGAETITGTVSDTGIEEKNESIGNTHPEDSTVSTPSENPEVDHKETIEIDASTEISSKEESIVAKDEEAAAPESSPAEKQRPNTGDRSHVGVWILGAVISMVGVVLIVYLFRRTT